MIQWLSTVKWCLGLILLNDRHSPLESYIKSNNWFCKEAQPVWQIACLNYLLGILQTINKCRLSIKLSSIFCFNYYSLCTIYIFKKKKTPLRRSKSIFLNYPLYTIKLVWVSSDNDYHSKESNLKINFVNLAPEGQKQFKYIKSKSFPLYPNSHL